MTGRLAFGSGHWIVMYRCGCYNYRIVVLSRDPTLDDLLVPGSQRGCRWLAYDKATLVRGHE